MKGVKLVELKQYEGGKQDLGVFLDVGTITTITKDPNVKGNVGNGGLYHSIKFWGDKFKGKAKAFGEAAILLQELVENAPLNGSNGRPLTQPVLIKGYCSESKGKDADGNESYFDMAIYIEGVSEAPSITKALWSYPQD